MKKTEIGEKCGSGYNALLLSKPEIVLIFEVERLYKVMLGLCFNNALSQKRV